jgi:chromosome segregation ATPase
MIESLLIKDFQIHRNLLVEFEEQVTTVVGPNDSGKSAILRALGFVALNNLSGSRFVRRGKKSKQAVVELKVDGHTVKRVRGKTENAYYLDSKEFKAFGVGAVPPEVESLLALSPINFQNQIDPPFWFLETAGQVSKNLNKIVNLDLIDRVLTVAAQSVRTEKSRLQVSEERVKQYRTEVQEKKWVVAFDADLRALAKLEAASSETALAASNLRSLVKSAVEIRSTIRRLKEARLDAENVEAAAQKLHGVSNRVATLKLLVRNAMKAEATIAVEIPDTSKMDALRAEGDKAYEQRASLDAVVTNYENLRRVLCSKEKQLKQTEIEMEAKTKGQCPVCQKPLGKNPPSPSSSVTYTSPTGRRSPG